MTINEASIKESQIINGSLKCTCGNEYQIVDGVLYIGIKPNNENDINTHFIDDYIKQTDNEYLKKHL